MQSVLPLDTSPDIAALAPKYALLPVGAMEQHGPHLPVTTDTIIASAIAKRVSEKIMGIQLPAIAISCSHEHAAFPGSISISANTLSSIIRDIVDSVHQQNIEFTVIINAHGGNYVIGNIVQELNVNRAHVFLCPTRQHWEKAAESAGVSSTVSADMHGGEIETSLIMYICPSAVRDKSLFQDVDVPSRPFLSSFGMSYYTNTGIIGFPTKASPEKGEKLLSNISDLISNDILRITNNRT